jgi:integration host factor subunit alpha
MFAQDELTTAMISESANVSEDQKPHGTLTRQDIAEAIFAKCPAISKREAKRLVDSVIEAMVETLCLGETVKLHDFGSFIVRDKGERAGRNPRTGARVPIEPRKAVVFKPSPNMKATVNCEERNKNRPGRRRKSSVAAEARKH